MTKRNSTGAATEQPPAENQTTAEDIGRIESYVGLRQALEWGAAAHRDSLETDDHGREGVKLQLMAVLAYLNRAHGISIDTLMPLYRLRDGLYDVSSCAKLPPLLERPKRAGRPPDTLERRRMKLVVAAAMTRFMQLGMPEMEAARKVARILNAASIRWPGSTNSANHAKTVKGWRDQVEVAPDFYGHIDCPDPELMLDAICKRLNPLA